LEIHQDLEVHLSTAKAINFLIIVLSEGFKKEIIRYYYEKIFLDLGFLGQYV